MSLWFTEIDARWVRHTRTHTHTTKSLPTPCVRAIVVIVLNEVKLEDRMAEWLRPRVSW
jgi:hypothetical protein